MHHVTTELGLQCLLCLSGLIHSCPTMELLFATGGSDVGLLLAVWGECPGDQP